MKFAFFILTIFLSTTANAQFISGKFSAGGEYNQWKPLDLAAVEITTEGYQVGYVELGLEFAGFSVSKLRYETNFGGAHQDEIIALQEDEGEFSKYENIIGILNFSGLVAKYNRETYISDVSAVNNFRYVNREGSIQPFSIGQNASFATQFESLFLGKDIYNFTMGVFYSTYKKPYFITDDTLQDRYTMYYADFTSYGVETFKLLPQTSGLPISTEVGLKAGFGEVDLGSAGTVTDIISSTDGVAYFELYLAPNWTKTIGEHTAFNFSIEANYKYFYRASEDKKTTIGEDRGFNSDITVKALASAVYRF